MNFDAPKDVEPVPDPETWVDLYGNYLYRYALTRLSDPEVAQDIVQETFVAAIDAFKRFRGKSSIKTWLIAILKRKIVDHFRRAKNHHHLNTVNSAVDDIDRAFNNSGNWLVKPNDWTVNPGKAYEQQEFIDILYKCISKLPDRQAEIFMMREFEDMSTEQICHQLNITESNSWVILYRARLQLRSCLETNWLGKPE